MAEKQLNQSAQKTLQLQKYVRSAYTVEYNSSYNKHSFQLN